MISRKTINYNTIRGIGRFSENELKSNKTIKLLKKEKKIRKINLERKLIVGESYKMIESVNSGLKKRKFICKVIKEYNNYYMVEIDGKPCGIVKGAIICKGIEYEVVK